MTATNQNRLGERRLAFILVAPAALLMLAVTAYPIGYAIWLSLQRNNLTTPNDTRFIGLGNYQTILTDRYWWTALAVTLAITVASVSIEFVLGLALALAMHRTLIGRGPGAYRGAHSVRHRHGRRLLQLVLRLDARYRLSGQPAATRQRASDSPAFVAGRRRDRRGMEDNAVHVAVAAGRPGAGAGRPTQAPQRSTAPAHGGGCGRSRCH